MTTKAMILTALVLIIFNFLPTAITAQTPVTDVGAGIQRESLWEQEKGIL